MEIVYLPKVKKFIKESDADIANRIISYADILEEYAYSLEMPISKALGRGLFELRIIGSIHVRIFYCFHKDKVYLMHAVVKKRNTIPKRDIDLVRKLQKQVAQI